MHPLLESYPGAALEVSADGTVAASNGRLDALVGRSVVGRPLAEVLDSSSQPKWRSVLADPAEDRSPALQLVIVTPDTLELRTFLAVPGRVESGAILWLLEHPQHPKVEAIYGELSEVNAELVQTQRELAAERRRLSRALEQAERAVRTRDEVLAVVSHDLKNPLNTITMAAELLKMPIRADQKEAHIEVIERSARGMSRLIGDLLDAGALDAGRLRLEKRAVGVSGILREIQDMFQAKAREKGQRLEVSADGDAVVVADRLRLLQALGNLVQNAVKFTPDGGTIAVHAERSAGSAMLRVRDSGPGIPEEQLAHVFDRFWHGSQGGGTGLGLSIAKGIVEAHGGRIWAESREGEGATFAFTLPLEEVAGGSGAG